MLDESLLLLITQVAGILLLLGTMILLFFRRIVLDSETKSPMKFKLPIFGEIQTQAPVLVLVLVAAVMVIYPLSKAEAPQVSVSGDVDPGSNSMSLLIVADPDYTHNYDAKGPFEFKFPLLRTQAKYRVKYIVDRRVIDDQSAVLKNGKIVLREVVYQPAPVDDTTAAITPKKDISDEDLRKLSVN